MSKSFESYEKEYQSLPFERHQASLRRREVLRFIQQRAPRSIAEVGCGTRPLFIDLHDFDEMAVVEPGDNFAQLAREQLAAHPQAKAITIHNCRLEDLPPRQQGFDLMVLAGLLHEIPQLPIFLQQAAAVGGQQCEYLIVVPNANSFHRQFAVREGMIDDVFQLSAQQQKLQQFRTFDLDTLESTLQSAGFKISQSKSIIFKPFTHHQMEQLLAAKILTEEQIYTFCEMVDLLPDSGSELLVVARYEG